jgi:hypothetical protein
VRGLILAAYNQPLVLHRARPSVPPPSSAAESVPPPLSAGEIALVAAVIALLATLVTYPLVRLLTRALPGGLGDPVLNMWTLAWVAERLPHGLRGVWDAPIFFPYRHTLAFSEHLIGIALLVAPVYWLSQNAVLAYNGAFLGSYVLAGTTMYLLARDLAGRRDVAWLAALAFAFHPYRTVHVAHLQVLMWGWMPLALWGLHRYFATGSRRALAVFTAAFLLLSLSNGYFLYFFGLAVVVVIAVQLPRSPHRRQAIRDLAVVAGVVALCVAPVASAYFVVRREYGLARTLGETIHYSADVASYFQTTDRLWWWGAWLRGTGGERELFPGLVVSALALAAVGARRTRRDEARGVVALYAAIAVVAFVFSLGPEPTAWGYRLPLPGPYAWLWRVVPGVDGLRVPARFAAIVYLALTVLAALGARRVLGALPRRGALAATVVLGLALVVEGFPAPAGLAVTNVRVLPSPTARAAYGWLRQAPPGAVLELPLGNWADERELERELGYQAATLLHGKPIVNGYSGYRSALREFLRESVALSPAELPAAVQGLRAIGVNYLVVHLDQYPDPAYAMLVYETLRQLERSVPNPSTLEPAPLGPLVREHIAFGRAVVFRLAPWSGPPLTPVDCARRLDARRFRATASHAPDRLPQAFDGDVRTRWLSGRAQEGDEWVLVEFPEPQSVAAVRIELDSWGDYPRELIVEGRPVRSDGTAEEAFREFYRGPVLALMMAGVLREPARAPVQIPLPAGRLAALRLRQLGRAQPWFWSMNELVLCAP